MRIMMRSALSERFEQGAGFRVSDAARSTHLAAIESAIEVAPPIVGNGWTMALRRRITGFLVATMTLAPAGVALAAQNALPGETLYPVKRAVEKIQVMFDPSIPDRHRSEESTALAASGPDTEVDEVAHDTPAAGLPTEADDGIEDSDDGVDAEGPEDEGAWAITQTPGGSEIDIERASDGPSAVADPTGDETDDEHSSDSDSGEGSSSDGDPEEESHSDSDAESSG